MAIIPKRTMQSPIDKSPGSRHHRALVSKAALSHRQGLDTVTFSVPTGGGFRVALTVYPRYTPDVGLITLISPTGAVVDSGHYQEAETIETTFAIFASRGFIG